MQQCIPEGFLVRHFLGRRRAQMHPSEIRHPLIDKAGAPEAEGWLLMQIVKDVRQWQNPAKYQEASALDGVAYASPKAEALAAGVKP